MSVAIAIICCILYAAIAVAVTIYFVRDLAREQKEEDKEIKLSGWCLIGGLFWPIVAAVLIVGGTIVGIVWVLDHTWAHLRRHVLRGIE